MNDRFKFRIWDEKEKRFLDHPQINPLFGCVCGYENSTYPLQIEQCTGLKDRNGNLMYENDVVSARGGDYKIVWADTECGWAIQHTKTKLCRSMNCFDGDEFVIQNTGDKK